ncbi:fumarylacetoacetate hydrolase family protein [Omnitrophica bacterium]|nr:fumarylacetoacetate hydrolase family protein [Candidatus Omnitrophota bacterium]
MPHYWLTYGNNRTDADRLQVMELPYPLSYHIPQMAFSDQGSSFYHSPKEEDHEVGVEILFKINRQLRNASAAEAHEAIESFHSGFSVTNRWHIRQVEAHSNYLTDQDEADIEYYSRWWDKSNVIGPVLDAQWGDLAGKHLIFKVGIQERTTDINYFHSPVQILRFVSSFTTLYPETYLGMGQLIRIPYSSSEGRTSVSVEIDGLTRFESDLCLGT